jgi:hypothetical protein
LEEAQHMERISLLQGLDNPNDKPKVDVLVPNGTLAPDQATTGRYYEMRLNLIPENLELLAVAVQRAFQQQESSKLLRQVESKKISPADTIKNDVALMKRAVEGKGTQILEYNGAAFANASEQGALSFLYAGITRSTELSGTKEAPAPETRAPAPAVEAPASGMVMTRMLGLKREMTANLQRDIEARSAVWLSMELAQDPTTVSRGKSVTVKAECTLEITMDMQLKNSKEVQRDNADAAAANAGAARSTALVKVIRVSFTGDFTVDDVVARTGSNELREAKGTLSGDVTVSIRTGGTVFGQDQETLNFYLSERVGVQRSLSTNGPVFKISASDWSILRLLVTDIEVEREWTAAQKAEAVGTIHFQVPKQAIAKTVTPVGKEVVRQAFRAWQTINPQVAEPQHPAHEDAIRALRAIGAALGSPRFADLAAQRLFPAPKPASSNLNVLATLDWVMFHRRREKTCHQEAPVLPLGARQYALYHLQLNEDQDLSNVRKQLERTVADAQLPTLDFVQLVEFGAGIHAVTSSQPQLQASWRQDVGVDAGKIVGGFIASHGVAATEGARLAQERLETLVDVIATVTPEELNPAYQVLNRVPDALDTPSNDGVIIVVTRVIAATNNHMVYAVENESQAAQLETAAGSGGFFSALKGDKKAIKLGPVKFSGDLPDADQLRTVLIAWTKRDYKPAAGAIVFSNTNDAEASKYGSQSSELLRALDGRGESKAVSSTESFRDEPAVTIIVGSVQSVLYVYSFSARPAVPNHPLTGVPPNSRGEFRNGMPYGKSLERFIGGLSADSYVYGITLATTHAAPDETWAAGLKAVVDAALAAKKVFVPSPPFEAGKVFSSEPILEQLNSEDHDQLDGQSLGPDGYDAIVFFEDTLR